MICKTCGKELQSGDRFCSRCGSKVEEEKQNYFEEVVFNPPFKLEKEEESAKLDVTLDEPPRKKTLFDTIDFQWDISGYPSADDEPRKKIEEPVFDWTAATGVGLEKPASKSEPKAEPKPVQYTEEEKEVIENITRMEEGMPAPEKEYVFGDTPVEEEPKQVTAEAPLEEAPVQEAEPEEPVQEEPASSNPVKIEPFETEMPKGNGISADEFLESLKNHVPRAEREGYVEKEAKKPAEGRKGLAAFFKNAFLEPEEEELEEPVAEEYEEPVTEKYEEPVQEEPADEPVVEPVAEPVAEPERPLEFVGVCHGTRTLEVVAYPVEKEINQFLPPDQRETGEYNPSADATRIVDKFYTFNQKNVEFQELLDQEYEKIRGDKSLEEIKEEVRQSNEAASQLAKDVLELKEEADAKAKSNRANWDEIFDDSDEDQPKKKSKGGKAFGTILVILILLVGGGYGVKTFMPDTQAADFVNQVIDKAKALVSSEESENAETVQAYIDDLDTEIANIDKVEYSHSLAIDLEKNYGVNIESDCEEFVNSTFSDQKGNKTTFGDMITECIVKHYSKKADTAGYDIESLKIGDYLSGAEGFYARVKYKVSGEDEANEEILYMTLRRDKIIVKSVNKI